MTTTLDTLVATAMGYKPGNIACDYEHYCVRECGVLLNSVLLFSPSTNIAHAMDALEEVVGTGYYQLDNGWHDDGKGGRTSGHTCTITLGTGTYKGTAASPAMAISLACVRACGVPEEKIKEAMDGK